jgi:regulator of nucleoside diphosphate kinase
VTRLAEELDFAEIVAPENIRQDVVTMRSKVKLTDLDTNEESVYTIVFPTEANIADGKISILAPLATALLGHRLGDAVEFKAPSGIKRLRIEGILYQPESAGDFEL